MNLPSGEDHRLRFVQPLLPDLVAALQTNEISPAYIADKRLLRELVALVCIAGGILRSLVKGAELAREESPSDLISSTLDTDGGELRAVAECCWQRQRYRSGGQHHGALRGKLEWGRAKALYDDGLVRLVPDSSVMLVEPVSPVAEAVIMQTLAALYAWETGQPQ